MSMLHDIAVIADYSTVINSAIYRNKSGYYIAVTYVHASTFLIISFPLGRCADYAVRPDYIILTYLYSFIDNSSRMYIIIGKSLLHTMYNIWL